tara:strand:- start:2162 stop:2719 length:558 start_codon:yes stop_codon:yes gene_type:complete
MRIIGGVFKGRTINFLKNSKTRPLKSNVRESIFNILKHSSSIKTNIESSNILDLYSGIGSFGIECLSRGANKVTFIEQDLIAMNILKENLIKFALIKKSKVYLNKIEDILAKDFNEKFNIFFLDPPFSDSNFLKNLETIKNLKIFDKKHIVIIHREKKSKDNFKHLLKIIGVKLYGRSKIIFGIF